MFVNVRMVRSFYMRWNIDLICIVKCSMEERNTAVSFVCVAVVA